MKQNKKYTITILTHKDKKWVEEVIGDAVRRLNDSRHRGFPFTPPIKKYKIKRVKKKKMN
jgi:hypothetical protein